MRESDVRILVVDDNQDAADSVAMMLELNGYLVKVLYDSREALRLIDEYQPHVGVFDIGMPHVSGYQLATKLKAAPFAPRAVVAISGWGTEADKEAAAQYGFDLHITKPADPHELNAFIRERCRDLIGAL